MSTANLTGEGVLASFGYKQEPRRWLSFWTNFAVGFAFISPVIAWPGTRWPCRARSSTKCGRSSLSSARWW